MTPHIHTDAEDIASLYKCIDKELVYITKLVNEESVVPLLLQGACESLERQERTLQRKMQKDIGKIPQTLCDRIVKNILQLEQNATMHSKITHTLTQSAVFFACLERIKGEAMTSSTLSSAKVAPQKNMDRLERCSDAGDHKKREGR